MLAVAMEPKDWIALAGVGATVIIAAGSLIASSLAQRNQQRHNDAMHEAQLKREDRMRGLYQNVEFQVDCRVHGRQDEDQLVEFLLSVHNQGLVQYRFTSMLLRVRGIERNRPFTYWEEDKPRLEFPVKIVDSVEVKPRNLNYVFVDPGVRQVINYVTKISVRIEYILAHAEFHYDRYTPHSSERVFRLAPPESHT